MPDTAWHFPLSAGGASPVVVNGRIYQFRYEPAGEIYAKHADQYLPGGAKEEEGRKAMEQYGKTP